MTFSKATTWLFLATLFSVTFEKVHWSIAGQVALADLLTIGFLASFLLDTWHVRRWPRTVGVVLLFLAGFLIVYFIGYFNIDTQDALNQFGKGLTKFVIHFLFLAAAVAYLAWGTRATYWRALAAFVFGMTANAAYGVVQLLVARAGGNLDSLVLGPITGGASAINIYGAVNGANVFRPNALTGDPNHLGIMLVVPLLVLTPVYLRLEKGHRLRWPLGDPARVPAPRRGGDALAQRPARADRRRPRAGDPVSAQALLPGAPRTGRRGRRHPRRDRLHAPPLLRGRVPLARLGEAAARPTSRSTA